MSLGTKVYAVPSDANRLLVLDLGATDPVVTSVSTEGVDTGASLWAGAVAVCPGPPATHTVCTVLKAVERMDQRQGSVPDCKQHSHWFCSFIMIWRQDGVRRSLRHFCLPSPSTG